MVEAGTEPGRVVLAVNMDAQQRIAAERPVLPFTFSFGPVPTEEPANSIILHAETHTDPSSKFTLAMKFLPPSRAEEVYDKLVAQNPKNISEECPPITIKLTPSSQSPVPRLRGEIARIFDSFDQMLELEKQEEAVLTGLALGAFLVRPDTTHAYLEPGKGHWHLLRIADPVDFFLALNFNEKRGEFFSKGALSLERNPGKLLAYAVA